MRRVYMLAPYWWLVLLATYESRCPSRYFYLAKLPETSTGNTVATAISSYCKVR